MVMIWLLPRKTIPAAALLLFAVGAVRAQQPVEPKPGLQEPKKANERAEPARPAEPFDGASVDELAAHCVSLETELGTIEIGMLAEMAPEAVRNFLNLASLGPLTVPPLAGSFPASWFRVEICPRTKI